MKEKRFRVEVYEVYIQTWMITASSEEEAKEIALNEAESEGVEDLGLDYDHTEKVNVYPIEE